MPIEFITKWDSVLESVYEKCLLIEFKKAGLQAESQRSITVYYEDEVVGRVCS